MLPQKMLNSASPWSAFSVISGFPDKVHRAKYFLMPKTIKPVCRTFLKSMLKIFDIECNLAFGTFTIL